MRTCPDMHASGGWHAMSHVCMVSSEQPWNCWARAGMHAERTCACMQGRDRRACEKAPSPRSMTTSYSLRTGWSFQRIQSGD